MNFIDSNYVDTSTWNWTWRGQPTDVAISTGISDRVSVKFTPADIIVNDMMKDNEFVYSEGRLYANSTTINKITMDVLKLITETEKKEREKIMSKRVTIADVKKVIINDPATIVLWKDGTKTVVKCMEGDTFDPEKGVAMALVKKMFEDSSSRMHKWIHEQIKDYSASVQKSNVAEAPVAPSEPTQVDTQAVMQEFVQDFAKGLGELFGGILGNKK